MSLQDFGSNYPKGHPGECVHGMQDDGVDCIQCKNYAAKEYIEDILKCLDDWDDDPEPCDYTDEIRNSIAYIKSFLNKIDPEIKSWKRVVAKLTHEKGVFESRCSYYETGLKLIVEKCINCPDTAQFANAVLDGSVQLHTESVVSWDKDCDECNGMGFIRAWIYKKNEEIRCPKCAKRHG